MLTISGNETVWPESAYHARGYYITNTASKLENPDGERWSAILMKDMKNVVINGSGALLLVHGVMTPILLDGCEDIIFRDFNLDPLREFQLQHIVPQVCDAASVAIPWDAPYREGCTYQVRDGIRNQVGAFVHRSRNVTFEGCGFHYMHGLGIVGQYSENLTLPCHRIESVLPSPSVSCNRYSESLCTFIRIYVSVFMVTVYSDTVGRA